MAQLARGETAPVADALPGLLDHARRAGRPQDRAVALALTLALDASGAMGAKWDKQLDELTQLLDTTGFKDGDMAMLLARAGAEAASRAPQRALAVFDLARAQWAALGRMDRAAQIDETLRSLRS